MMYDSDDDYFTSYKPYGLIYKLTLPRGKIYIGKTTQTIDARFEQHRSMAYAKAPVDSYGVPYGEVNVYKHNSSLYKAMRRCGKREIIIEEIDQAYSKEELADKERYWIKEYDSILD